MSGLELNPREVLDHLYELGYKNITGDQLKEFVKDLKKLIKFDQRMNQGGAECEEDDESSDECEQSRPGMSHPVTGLTENTNKQQHKNANIGYSRDGNTNNSKGTSVSCNSSDFVDSRPKSLRTRFETRDDRPKSSQRLGANRPCSSKENLPPTRSSSFIRPWKYQCTTQKPGYLSNRSDPVALYHKYQALWQQNKIPGEETHSGLRWNIRERMLGQDPHPRPISQASSLESMPKRRAARM